MKIKDLFIPKWKNSDPHVRIAAIKDLLDGSILKKIVKDDPDRKVQLAAFHRIHDLDFFEVICSCPDDAFYLINILDFRREKGKEI